MPRGTLASDTSYTPRVTAAFTSSGRVCRLFGVWIWTFLGWNVHVYHAHPPARRVWHACSVNRSAVMRKAVFFGYTYRWVASQDEPVDPAGLHPIQTQLFGAGGDSGDHLWGHHPGQTPLYEYLREHGFLDPASPPLKP